MKQTANELIERCLREAEQWQKSVKQTGRVQRSIKYQNRKFGVNVRQDQNRLWPERPNS